MGKFIFLVPIIVVLWSKKTCLVYTPKKGYMYRLYQIFEGYIQQYSPENDNFLSEADFLSEAEHEKDLI